MLGSSKVLLMIEFILSNLKLIVSGILVVISVIVFILRKKPVNDIETFIFKAAIEAVNLVEVSGKSGEDKLSAAITYICAKLLDTYPGLDTGRYINFISKVIEAILSTPQKK